MWKKYYLVVLVFVFCCVYQVYVDNCLLIWDVLCIGDNGFKLWMGL